MADQDDFQQRPFNIDDEGQPYPLEKMVGGGRRRTRPPGDGGSSGRVPPQAVDVEQSVLGAMLIEQEAIPRAIEILQPDAFYIPKHQKIYLAVLSLFERGNPVDLITLTEELKRRNELDDVGGAYYLSELTTKVASAANVEYHARIIAEKSLLRKMIETMTGLIGKGYDPGADAFELLDQAESEIFRISETQLRKAASSMNEVLKSTLAQLEAIHGREGGITGVPSGFSRLDALTGGWQNSDLIIIAARPSMGKCLGKGTLVMMYDGTLKPVEDVRVGDRLMGDDSTPRTVLSLARGREMMYWVRQTYGMDYRVNESHILSLKKSRREGREPRGAVTHISVREYLRRSDKWKSDHKGYKVAVDFPEQPLPLDPYLLGLWLGDGKSDSARIYSRDPAVVEYLFERAEARGERVSVYDTHRPCPAYLITGGRGRGRFSSVQAALRKLGVLNDKHIPHVYLANSRTNRLRLLAGLIDSDGHLNAGHGGTYEITQTNKRVAQQIKYLCDTLGYRCSIKAKRTHIPQTGFEGIAWRVRFNGNVEEIPVRIARKKARPWTDGRDWTVSGIRVEPDRVDEYYGFVLDGNHLFLLADGTVTHNTAFSLACARNAALHPQHPAGVAIFSLEMSAQQLAQRLLTAEARVDAQAARTGRLSEDDWPRLARAAGKLSAAPIFIDDTPGLSILELRAKCRRLKAEHDIGLVVVDYLQLMHGTHTSKNANREQEIAQISRSLKSLAKELNVPVIALSQLSRAVETRGGDKRPQLSDLRESGCLTGDTLVTRADTGARVPIRDLAARCPNGGCDVWALDPATLKLARAPVSRAFSTGVKPVYKITTRLGRTIRATANHKFLTVDGWKRLDALTPADHLALPRSSTEAMPETEPALCDHLIGDGGTSLFKQNDSRRRAKRVTRTVASEPLLKSAESDVYWDGIVSIEPDGVEEVFDLTVPGPHNFVANDIIVHNSIEQDADVVMFIYRPERYGITVDDQGNSTEGLAEIIIGKQRNGPIGDVRLAFVKNFARFENLTMHYAPDGFDQGGFDQGGGDGAPVPPPPGDAPF
ncbi:replicative DNA helicase [Rhodocaloribacter sp.]